MLSFYHFMPLLLLLIAACNPIEAAPETLPSTSLWGTVYTLGQVEQSAAPALWPTDSRVFAGWIGADDAGVHQDARVLAGTTFSDITTLPLPPNHPYAQQVYPAGGDHVHLLWLDASTDAIGENRLYSALISPALTVERGPTMISDALTLRYTAVAAGDGGVWVVWSGGILAETILYAQYIDKEGRPRQPNLIERGGDYPALARANDGTLHLVWLQTQPLQTYIRHATLKDGSATQSEAFAIIDLSPGTRLIDLYAGLDATHLYVFFNVVLPSGEPASWVVTRPLDGVWGQPGAVSVQTGQPTTINTGFNSGSVNDAQSGEQARLLRWVRPMAGQFDTLPVAGLMDGELAVGYFQGGRTLAYQPIVPVNTLLAPPNIETDRDRHLYLAWSEPTNEGYAELKITMTRR
jgi:hypothetical protein